MLVRLGFLVAASIAAYSVKQLNRPGQASLKSSENGKKNSGQHQVEGKKEQVLADGTAGKGHVEEQEEEEEVKRISILNSPSLNSSAFLDDEHMILPELTSKEIEFSLPNEKFDLQGDSQSEKANFKYETGMAKNVSELECLKNLVRELEERGMKLEDELLEYHALKEQESDIEELQRQLKVKTAEIDELNATIQSLQAERKKLQEEIEQDVSAGKELETARNKIKELQRQIQLEANQTKAQLLMLKQQLASLQVQVMGAAKKEAELKQRLKSMKELEVEVLELRRRNKELQHEKRELIMKLDAAEAKLTALANISETEMVAKARDEVNSLKNVNENLSKQVEGLQMNRFNEVEELAYLRWVNACLRYELQSYQTPSGKISARDLSRSLSPRSRERAKHLMLEYAGSERGQGDTDADSISSLLSSSGSDDIENTSRDSSSSRSSTMSKKLSLIQKLKKWGKSRDDSTVSSPRSLGGVYPSNLGSSTLMQGNGIMKREEPAKSPDILSLPCIRTQISSNDSLNSVASSFQLMSKSVEGVLDDKYPAYKDTHKLASERENTIKERAQQARIERFGNGYNPISDTNELRTKTEMDELVTSRPKLAQVKDKFVSNLVSSDSSEQPNDNTNNTPVESKMRLAQLEKRPPRIPRPPPKRLGRTASTVATTANPSSGIPSPPPWSLSSRATCPPPPPGNLLEGTSNNVHRTPEVKADAETQGDFVQFLATEVLAASFDNIEDLVSFVNWLDEELSFLVDEHAVLKHFYWPEDKADALREATFEYQTLVKLETQLSSFVDDPKLSCESALNKMYSLLEKLEQEVYSLLQVREMSISRYQEFGIPVDWLMDSGAVGKIKLSSLELARKYIKRVASELEALSGPDKEPNTEFLILQGVRFAFRVHQLAGGFDTESMLAFEELRNRARSM